MIGLLLLCLLMKHVLLVCSLCLDPANVFVQRSKRENNQTTDPLTVERRFQQKLDHFNNVENRTFEQRYFENFRYHRLCGPMFLILGGEGPVQAAQTAHHLSFTTTLARQFGGALFLLEHRYYGDSFPTENRTDFEFLSSRQAIEDVANFIRTISQTYKLPKQWILVGCSYPGSLATWMRNKYPDLTLGAISISAPLEVMINFQDYKEAVSNALWRISEPCAARLRDGFDLLNAELQLQDNWERVATELNLNLTTPETNETALAGYNREATMSALMISFLFALGGQVQSKPLEIFRKDLCHNIVLDMRRPLLKMLAAVKDVEQPSNYDARAWSYQLCNEFGWFITSSSNSKTSKREFWPDLFAFNATIENASEFCRYYLGENYQPDLIHSRVLATQKYYGNIDELNLTNVIFVQGELDPWLPLQMKPKHLKPNNVLITIKDATHCASMFASHDPHVRNAQSLIIQTVDEWLRQKRSCCIYYY